MKVVYNACYGGFGLSDKAIEAYLIKKEIPYYKVKTKMSFNSDVEFYKTEPSEELKAKFLQDYWDVDYTKEETRWKNDNSLYSIQRDLERHDPILIQIVEELGKEANGMSADLQIDDITGNKYRINEYDGNESVSTPADTESEWTTV